MTDRSLTMRRLNAEKLGILNAVAEARLQRTGSPLWWLAARAVRTAANQHVSSVETGVLPRFGQQTSEWTRQELGCQWNEFITDLTSDGRRQVWSD